ncbi:hypothetical protein GOM49_02815 [Clostridium bovifaecis]|uniref:Sigma factor regulator C-terminal domain-containing protein n=1 Tax=Clostridium bovifaecis TaxID=2184719 RepID=A0A6I6EQ56_9CLOT|nr:hypothetical protein GOM49_02815 [Clostridium bovifaecis]
MDIRYPNPRKDEMIEIDNEEIINHINDLNPVSYISSYIIFKEDLSIKELEELRRKYSDKVRFTWVGVRTKNESDQYSYLSGFNPNFSDGSVTADNSYKNKYPYLQLVDSINEESRKNFNGSFADVYSKHFISLLKYMNDREKTVKALDSSSIKAAYYKSALSYVERNGVNIYGILVYGEAKELLKFINSENVKSIEIDAVLPSKYVN